MPSDPTPSVSIELTNTPIPTITSEPSSDSSTPTLECLSNDKLFLMTCHSNYDLERLIQTYIAASEPPAALCSTYFAQNEDQDYIMGRNFDYDYSPALVIVNDPADGYRSISVANLAFAGYTDKIDMNHLKNDSSAINCSLSSPLDGINEKGVSMSVMESKEASEAMRSSGKTKINAGEAIRLVLDRAASTQEAIEVLDNYDLCNSYGKQYHFLIADANGSSVVIEYSNNEMVVLHPDNFYQCCTNFVLQPYMESHNTSYPCYRYRMLNNKLTKTNGILSVEEAKQLLRDVRQNTTQWSCIYNNTDCSMEISIGEKEDAYFKVSLSDLK